MRSFRLFSLMCGCVWLWACSTPPPYQSPRATELPGSVGPTAPVPAPPVSPGPTVPAAPRQGSLAYLDYKNGFRDLRFGSVPEPGMVTTEGEGEFKIYRRPADEMTIGDSTLESLRYGYYQNRLSHVLMKTKGFMNSRALLEVLRQAYGRGTQPNQFMQRYYWWGGVVDVSYDENSITNDAVVMFTNKAIDQEKRTAEANRARKGASGL